MSVVIGLTGGIGAGKSVAAQLFAELGAVIVDADEVAREVVMPGQPALAEIVQAFGQEVLTTDGELNRQVLAQLVFADSEKLAELNRITHPRIIQHIDELVQKHRKQGAEVIIIDAALLIETGLWRNVDKVLVVAAEDETRIRRIIRRNGFSREEAQKRLQSQMPQDEKVRQADFVIYNEGSLRELEVQVRRVWEEILGENHRTDCT